MSRTPTRPRAPPSAHGLRGTRQPQVTCSADSSLPATSESCYAPAPPSAGFRRGTRYPKSGVKNATHDINEQPRLPRARGIQPHSLSCAQAAERAFLLGVGSPALLAFAQSPRVAPAPPVLRLARGPHRRATGAPPRHPRQQKFQFASPRKKGGTRPPRARRHARAPRPSLPVPLVNPFPWPVDAPRQVIRIIGM